MQIRIIIAQLADDIFKMILTSDWLLAKARNSRMIREISPVGGLEKSVVENVSCRVVVIEFGCMSLLEDCVQRFDCRSISQRPKQFSMYTDVKISRYRRANAESFGW